MIAGRYQIEDEIGAGGMGTVYRGLDTRTELPVAIKHLKPVMARPELIERFKREGAALRDLNHPNIVQMLDAVEEEGNHYLVLEYLPGGDLSNLLEADKIPTERVVKIAIEIADALTRAHHLNIIHRDLKPANVLLAEDGTPRLTDFGVAHIGSQDRITDTDAIVGTVDYLAPEVLNGGTIGPQADVWAFGVMLFEMLAGKRPFEQDALSAKITAILTAPVPDLEQLRPDAPVALVDLVYRMLARDLQARVRSVRQIGLELEDILHGRDNTPVATRFDPETSVETTIIQRRRHNLPVQTTPFIGREVELAELSKLLSDPSMRLITIVAPGGMGKTRLALEVAAKFAHNTSLTLFTTGIYLIELAPLIEADHMVSALADATGYQFQPDERDQKQQILDFMTNKDLLLVMDNFEHLLDGAELIIDILQAAPNVQILATSRQRLNQPGETVFQLAGMEFPEWETPEDALGYAAVKLFMNSAQRAQPRFELTENNMDHVARICRMVEGMPLGIVLAGGWIAMLTPEEIASEIADSLDFLESTSGDVPERQRSIRAVFEYSWDMLAEAEQYTFMKLCLFRGGFSREAAQAVTGAKLRTLMSLINNALLRRDAETGRYEIHELLRQFGLEHLQDSTDYTTSRDAHSHYFMKRTAQLAKDMRNERQINAGAEMRVEFENVVLAWQWAVEQRRFDSLVEAIDMLWLSHFRIGRAEACFALLEESVQAVEHTPGISDVVKAHIRLRWCTVAISIQAPSERIEAYLENSLQIAERENDSYEMWLTLLQTGRFCIALGKFEEAYDNFVQSYDTAEAANNHWGMAISAFFAGYEGKVTGVSNFIEYMRKAYALADEVGDLFQKAGAAYNLGIYLDEEREHEQSREFILETLNITRQLKSHDYPDALAAAGLAEVNVGNFEEAWAYFKQAAEQAEILNVTDALVDAEMGASLIHYFRDTMTEALPTIERVAQIIEGWQDPFLIYKVNMYRLLILHWVRHFEDARGLLQYIGINFRWNPADMSWFVVAMLPLLYHHKKYQRAAAYLSLILNDPKQYPVQYQNPHLLRLKTQLLDQLGRADFDAAWEYGKTLSLKDTVEELLEDYRENDA